VLLVESNPKGLARLAKTVAGAGADVISADSGDKALEVLASRDGRVDILLMDLDANGLSGAAFIRKARSVVPSLYVVMMSDDADREEIRAGYESGAAALIRKSTPAVRIEKFMKATLQAVLADRKSREDSRKRAERLAAEPFPRKALRWVKSTLHAHSHTRKAARAAALAFAILGMAIGAGSAVGLQFGYEQADRAEALSERLAQRMLPFMDQNSAREERAFGRFQAQEQLGMMREANAVTRRYYEGHLEEMRRQALPRSQEAQNPTLPGSALPLFESPRTTVR
jgi:DNA-binding response OmpR family regulator